MSFAGGPSTYAMLPVLLLGQFMALLDVTIVNVATPTIGTDLPASGAQLQLVVGGYTASYAMLLITGARLGDLYGLRRCYLAGAVGFTLASLACGLAPNGAALVAFRFVQGAAAAVMVPQIMSVIQTRFAGPARARAVSAYGAVLSVGAVAGLGAGGVLVEADLGGLGWRAVFLVNVPIGVLLAILVPRLVPADEPRGTRRLDLARLAVAVPAVFLVVLPLVLGRQLGWPPWTVGALALGAVLAGLFVVVERRVRDPLLSFAVLRARGVAAGVGTLICMQVTYGGLLFVLTLHLQAGLGVSPLRTGLTFAPMAAVFGAVGYWWRALPALGLGLCAVAFTQLATDPGHGMWVALVVWGAGMGASASPLVAQSLAGVPRELAADASGVLTTTMQLGQVIGVAGFGGLFLSLSGASPTAAGSARALAGTAGWLVPLAAAGVAAGVLFARSVVQQRSVR
ncbi:MAG: MFS transporter [Actinophytocola sp.]|uniref:MFS transporter n=1 Tax=Actinophytocola sp. TaxID=1872138 RepID=UPI0013264A6D|nr:MFS transporter [Actinophytocola sp.]MPZ85832.1 MFS transporter [Actinophytocola sp.]